MILLASLLLAQAAPVATAPAPPAIAATAEARALSGAWVVDLSTRPGEPYVRPMNLVLAADGTVSGLFYQSPIDAGRWKTDRGRTCVSFRTHDDRGPYDTSACLRGDIVEGQTWAEARMFLFNWNATRGVTR